MRKYFLFLFIPFFFAFCQQKDYKAQSEKIFEQIRNHEFSKVTAEFDSSMLAHIDTSRLRMVWDKLLPLTGPFVRSEEHTLNSSHSRRSRMPSSA